MSTQKKKKNSLALPTHPLISTPKQQQQQTQINVRLHASINPWSTVHLTHNSDYLFTYYTIEVPEPTALFQKWASPFPDSEALDLSVYKRTAWN